MDSDFHTKLCLQSGRAPESFGLVAQSAAALLVRPAPQAQRPTGTGGGGASSSASSSAGSGLADNARHVIGDYLTR